MKKFYFIFAFAVCGVFALTAVSQAETQVGGEIRTSTTWIKANSPYVLIRTVDIPKTVTLTIEPGVTVSMAGSFDMFTVKGKIMAVGTTEEPIVFDGGGNSSFFNALGSTGLTLVELDHVDIRNGHALWQNGFGSFNLRRSRVENLDRISTIVNPVNDIAIEENDFIASAGFSIRQGGENEVSIRLNRFDGRHPDQITTEDFLIQHIAAFENANTILENNSFLNITGIALALAPGEANAKLDAANNYWGTTDTAAIAAMIYDQNDNAAVTGAINFEPILSAPAEGTAGFVRLDPPTLAPLTTPTTAVRQTLSGTKPAGTAVWLNGSEIVAANETTAWSYELTLAPGENSLQLTVRDADNRESDEVRAVIVRDQPVCASWTYSDWDICKEGKQERHILAGAPEGCAGGEPVLERACDGQPAGEQPVTSVVAEEKALVTTLDAALTKRLSGRILLQVERNGEAWYVYPNDLKKYYLGRPTDAFAVMRTLGLGATHAFITGQTQFSGHVLGKILLDVEKNGEAYYINPVDRKAYYLGRPADAFRVMREQGLGITNGNLRRIGVGEL